VPSHGVVSVAIDRLGPVQNAGRGLEFVTDGSQFRSQSVDNVPAGSREEYLTKQGRMGRWLAQSIVATSDTGSRAGTGAFPGSVHAWLLPGQA